MTHNHAGDQDIRTLMVRCSGANDGCPWTGPISSFNEHSSECEHGEIPCPNRCTLNRVTVTIPRKQLQNHLENKCLKRQYACSHCGEPGTYAERTTMHLEACPRVKVHCPHLECKEIIPRVELETHKLQCQFVVDTCKFAELGCREQLPKRDLKAHEEDDHQHLQSVKEKVLELTTLVEEQDKMFRAQINQQNKDIESMKQNMGSYRKYSTPMYFRLLSFAKNKSQDKIVYSPPFYSSSGGYRMKIGVRPNGWGPGKNTHVSAFVYLQQGEYDNSLSWPFKGTVVVELINQLQDKNHLKFHIVFPGDEETSGRVTDRGQSGGWGKQRLIAHSKLGLDSKKSTQYLRNDTLYFKISIPDPSNRPWLECTA